MNKVKKKTYENKSYFGILSIALKSNEKIFFIKDRLNFIIKTISK